MDGGSAAPEGARGATATARLHPTATRSAAATVLLTVAIVAVALNQRPAVVSLGPVLPELRTDTGLSAALAGLLTTVPVLCFGAFSPVAPRLARKLGLEAVVALSLVLLAAGIALRLLPAVPALYVGNLVVGGAIAIANVLLPAYVKREYANPGPTMGMYTAALNVGAALGAVVTLPLGSALGLRWRGALGMWLVLALAALVVWLPVAGTGRARRNAAPEVGGGAWSLLRQPLAVQVTAYLGLQSVQFYAVAAWLPTLLVAAGKTLQQGATLLAVAAVVGAGGALVAPSLAGRMRTQRPMLVVVIATYAVGLAGLAFAPAAAPVVWIVLFGFAQGAGFALALTLIVLRSPTPLVAAKLSGVAQCLGYLVAAGGAPLLGVVHDATNSWEWPMVLLLTVLVPMAWVGWGAARNAVLAVPAPDAPDGTAG